MEPNELSPWAVKRFAEAGVQLRNAVIETVHTAHEAALAAHDAQGFADRDTYASCMRINLNKLFLEKIAGIEGVTSHKPASQNSRFELPVVKETNVVLYWWRYSSDGATPIEEAKIKGTVSELKKYLMTLSPEHIEPQMTLEQAALSDEELDTQFAEEELFLKEMSQAGRTVTLWVASGPDGVFDFGWGDAELVDADAGTLFWTVSESLKGVPVIAAPKLKLVDDKPVVVDRFDSDTEEVPFNLAPREQGESAPISEKERDAEDTGSEED